jgi:ribonuclease HII
VAQPKTDGAVLVYMEADTLFPLATREATELGEPPEVLVELANCAGLLAGVDEAGRGPIAGPVVAAAVILPPGASLPGVDDSKRLSPATREELFCTIHEAAIAVGVGVVEPSVIDRVNILRATHMAMRSAIAQLAHPPALAVIDGLPVPDLPCRHIALAKADERSLSVAAASIIAKVTRDRIMVELDRQHPGYGFARHKGYLTPQHLECLMQLGPCPIHRRSFAPVREALALQTPLPHLG